MRWIHTLRKILLFSILIGGFGVRSAVADVSNERLEEARHDMDLGQNAFNAGKYEAAASHFIDAFAAAPFSAFLYNAGLAHEKAGNTKKAIGFYRRYLEVDPGAADTKEVREKINTLSVQLEKDEPPAPTVRIVHRAMKSIVSIRTNPPDAVVRLLDKKGEEVLVASSGEPVTVISGAYQVEVSHPDYETAITSVRVAPGEVWVVVVEMSQGGFVGYVTVKTDTSGASVYLDDREAGEVGKTPWSHVMPTGSHTLWIEKPGFVPIVKQFEVSVGEKKELDISLTRFDVGALVVKTNTDGAVVYVDNIKVGGAPLSSYLPVGNHSLRVEADKMKPYEAKVSIAGGKTTKVLVRMNPKPSRTGAFISAGFTLALVAGGAIAGAKALGYRNDLDALKESGELANDDPRISKGFAWGLSSDIAFVLSAVMAGVTVYKFVRDPLPPTEGKQVVPEDFEANPTPSELEQARAFGKPQTNTEEQPAAGSDAVPDGEPDSGSGVGIMVAPILGRQSYGLGLTLSF